MIDHEIPAEIARLARSVSHEDEEAWVPRLLESFPDRPLCDKNVRRRAARKGVLRIFDL